MSSKRYRQERAEAQRVAKLRAQQRRRRMRLVIAAGVVVAAVIGVSVAVVLANRGPSGTAANPAAATSSAAAAVPLRTTPPPWPIPAGVGAAVAAAGLPMLGEEGNALHFHTHLDIFADGKPVEVPADIGVDLARRQISPLHSHDVTGVIHVESADAKATFSLGQFFTEWQVSLGADHIGGLRADETHPLKVYVNGTLRQGDPAAIMLAAHDEIAIVYGGEPASVPSSYQWTNGL